MCAWPEIEKNLQFGFGSRAEFLALTIGRLSWRIRCGGEFSVSSIGAFNVKNLNQSKLKIDQSENINMHSASTNTYIYIPST